MRALADYQQARWCSLRSAHAGTVMPGFTHLQTAQPVTFGHHLLAYVEMAARDRGRFADARKRLNESPLGAAALAGTSFQLDRDMTAKALELRPADGELARCRVGPRLRAGDAGRGVDHRGAPVAFRRGDRDLDLAAGRPSCKLSDKFTTGSSIMPQKRNPDAAELVRAKTGRIIGALHGAADRDEGLPLAYPEGHAGGQGRRDGRALARCRSVIAAMAGMVRDMKPDTARMKQAAGRGLFHRDGSRRLAGAHAEDAVPRGASCHRPDQSPAAEAAACRCDKLPLRGDAEDRAAHYQGGVRRAVGRASRSQSRTSFGGTAAVNVRREAAKWQKKLGRVADGERDDPCGAPCLRHADGVMAEVAVRGKS